MRKASFQLSTLLQANALGRETVDYTADGNLTPYKVQDLLGQVFDDPVRIDISKLDQEEKERILNELIQENLFFKSVGEKLINTSSQFTINHYHAPFNSIQAQEGVNIGGSLTGINNGEIKSTSTVTYPSELPEQLELFRNELKKLVEINEAQKTILYDAVGELIDKLNEPQEVQEKEKEKFKNLTKYFGIAEKSLGLLANFATAATFLGYAAYK